MKAHSSGRCSSPSAIHRGVAKTAKGYPAGLCSTLISSPALLLSSLVVAGACSVGGIEPSILGVYESSDGYGMIYIGDSVSYSRLGANLAARGDECELSLIGGGLGTVNVQAGNLDTAGDENCGVTASDSSLGQLTLPTFEASTSKNSAKYTTGDDELRIHQSYSESRNSDSLNDRTIYHPGLITAAQGFWCDEEDEEDQTLAGCFEVDEGTARLDFVDNFAIGVKSMIFSNRDWGRVYADDVDRPVYFEYDADADPYHIGYFRFDDTPVVIMEPGTYYISHAQFDGVNLLVRAVDDDGNALGDGSGKVKLYINNTRLDDDATTASTENFFDGYVCMNMDVVEELTSLDDLSCDYQNRDVVTNTDNVRADRLAIFIYNDFLSLDDDGSNVAASIYVADGYFRVDAEDTTIVGEIIAEDILIKNEESITLAYQDTGTFAELYTGGTVARSGEFSLANTASASQTSSGDYVYVPSQTDNTSESGITGHIKAFALQDDGTTSSTASWDANALMTADLRRERLWSTDADGALVKLTALDDEAFAISNSLSANTIIEYTIDPNYQEGAYLGSRDSSAMIGAPYISQPVVMGGIVVFQTDDGFVYGIDGSSGELKWGYIPRPLVAGLQDYNSFYSTHPMAGQLAVLTDSDSSTSGYLVGTGQSGDLHYALKIDGSGNLSSALWTDQRSANLAHSPLLMKIGSTPYAIWLAGNSTVVARSLSSSPTEKTYDVSNRLEDSDSQLTAAPMAVVDYVLDSSGNARVQRADLYLGDSDGYIYQGELVSGSSLNNNYRISTLGHIGTSSSASDAVLYLEHATKSSAEYVTAQSSTRLKTFRMPSDDDDYRPDWTSYAGGSGYWDESGTAYTAETTFTPNTEHIQKLPSSGATITDRVTIAASVIFLPVQEETETSCNAYYYLYRLEDGYFPGNTLYRTDLTYDNVLIGTGTAYQANLMVLNNKVVVQGSSDTNLGGISGVDDVFSFTTAPSGRSGWREVTSE
ncbi:pilus assembly protein [Oceanobacter kriegii]|uniref:hypothetical protein n=1 Tax=Oceanobacter kriegii TaxID=64972 RepID=UPI0004277480|nr:hypothetical protein [Oceanobacter kriegii]